MPLAVGLLDDNGQTLPLSDSPNPTTKVLVLSEAKQQFVFDQIASLPTVSFLRNFSAPVKVRFEQSEEELSRMMAADPDPLQPLGGRAKAGIAFPAPTDRRLPAGVGRSAWTNG